MKSFKIFAIVFGVHLFAVPIVILKISKDTTKDEYLSDKSVLISSIEKVSTLQGNALDITPKNTSLVHIVQQGENPSTIAFIYGMTTSELMGINSIVDARSLKVGDKLKVINNKG